MFPKIVLAAAALISHTTSVVAWGAAGHEIVATIAQIHLHPSVFPTMCAILNFTSPNPDEPQCHLGPIATWADTQRPKMPWSAPLHYVGAVDDYPSQTCAFPGPRGWADKHGANVLGGIRNVTDILMDWVYFNEAGRASTYQYEAANEALKFLVHFLGDMHQPLHLTGRDRGGNSIPVRFSGQKTSELRSPGIGPPLRAEQILSTSSPRIEYALRGTIYDSYVRMIMWEGILGEWEDEIPDWLACPTPARPRFVSPPPYFGAPSQQALSRIAGATDDALVCPHHWGTPIHLLNCAIVFPAALDAPYNDTRPRISPAADPAPYMELDTAEYSGVISEGLVVEKLLAQAGIRLAGLLNYLFADLGEEEGSRRLGVRS
ncbi:phospholipase C/P1 nuclease domain-containing protein [Mycena maculata]|uniref:Phospholipase C/P1 nuclease domain-containing protein n=1 Tax=Mycena maculata TaxID=230809 RepID=A0AAD7KG03_9AGAR|nr:phospholipase C/P1 nuclease domain-containing protein [Mycena maculata]